MKLNENGTFEITTKELQKIILSLTHILAINKACINTLENYFPNEIINGNFASQINEHYDNWIDSMPIDSNDYTENFGSLLTDLIKEARRIYFTTIYSIPADYIQSSHPNYEKMLEVHQQIFDIWNEMADYKTSEFVKNIEALLGE